MKRRITLSIAFGLAFCISAFAQPSDAQLKKQLTSARTVSVTLGGPGKIEWSRTYKKYVWSRNFTAKLRTDEPGVFLLVKGYISYDVMTGRYVYWRTFTTSNSYDGIPNPTIAELNQLVGKLEPRDIDNMWSSMIGEIESIRLAADPQWEWHTTNSVSFTVIQVYSNIYSGGSYNGEANASAYPMVFIDKVERTERWRIYRDGLKTPWKSISPSLKRIGDLIRDPAGESVPALKLLSRTKMDMTKADNMPRPTRIPPLTN